MAVGTCSFKLLKKACRVWMSSLSTMAQATGKPEKKSEATVANSCLYNIVWLTFFKLIWHNDGNQFESIRVCLVCGINAHDTRTVLFKHAGLKCWLENQS